MTVNKRRAPAFSAPILLMSLALLAGCGGAGAAADAPTATAPATPTATATPSAALPALPTVQVASGQCQQDTAGDVVYTPAGGLVVAQTTALGNLAYPSAQIPSQQTAPMLAPSLRPADFFAPSSVLPVNPLLSEGGGGYVLLICNLSSQAHVVSAVQASIARIRSFTGQLSAWTPCSGGTFGMTSGGCGGGDQQDDYMHAAFAPNAPEGASVIATLSNAGPYGVGPLPVTLKPGQSMTIEVGVTKPSAPGYYTYGFALTVDGANTGVVAYSPETLLAPVAHAWGGTCTSPQQTQIAETPTPTVGRNFYICLQS